jgi:isoquinoline 1-oxidoreductase beta subunit
MSVTRRSFLVKTVGATTGLMIGFRLDCAAKIDEATKVFSPNAFIEISVNDEVRLWATRSEMGQGVRTLLPMVLADELGADWNRIIVEQASPGGKFTGVRLRTSGSGSAVGTWHTLRVAAAAAREMLIAAAAERWNVPPSTCDTKNGGVIHRPSGQAIQFGEIVIAAAKLPVPKSPALRDPKDFSLIGKPIRRLDGQAIVTGRAIYGMDVKRPEMLYAVLARRPSFGAKLVSFDSEQAMRVRGVRHVLPVTTGIATGVAVLADGSWAALKGRAALKIRWSAGEGAAFDSDRFSADMQRRALLPGYPIRRAGAAEVEIASSSRIIDATYEYPFQAHATLETMNCTADVRDGFCEIWAPTQCPEVAQQETAKLLGISEDKVRVNITLLGGGFGRRLFADYVPEAVELSKAVGRPVQVLWTREDDMKYGFFQPPDIEVLRARLPDKGVPPVWIQKSVGSNLSMFGIPSEQDAKELDRYAKDGSPWGVFDNPYNLTHLTADFIPFNSPVPTGPWRSVEYPGTVFARESFIDEIAHAAGRDPIELRLAFLEPGDVLDLKVQKINRARLQNVLHLAAAKSTWGSKLPTEKDWHLGRGVACNVYSEDCYAAHVAEVAVRRDLSAIRVRKIICIVDCGLPLNPLGIEGQAESAIIWGLSATLGGKIHFKNGQAQETSYSDFEVIRMDNTPAIEIHIHQGADSPGGFGETAVPGVAPAVANAVFAACGKRVRRLPITPEKLAMA